MHRSLSLDDEASAACVEAPAQDASDAAARLFVEHARFVLRALVRLGVAEQDAQDVCQEVFLTVFRRHAQFLGVSRETTWLYGICLRVAANHRRKAHRRRERPHAEVPVAEPAPRSEADLDARRLMQRLDVALARLASKKREVFVLYEFAERDMEEVAQIVGAPLKTCYSRLYAARAELAVELAQQSSGVKP